MRLPEFVKKISPIGETLEAMDAGTALLAEEAAKRNRQLSVGTADSGLPLWEADYSLPGSGDTELRRARVRAAMAGGQTLTVEALKALAVTVGGADRGEVEEDFARYRVTLYALFEERQPEDVSALEEAVERLRPAHLTVEVIPALVLRGEVRQQAMLTGAVYLELDDRAP